MALNIKAPSERVRRCHVDPVHAVFEKTHPGYWPRARGADAYDCQFRFPRQNLRDIPELSGKVIVNEQDIYAWQYPTKVRVGQLVPRAWRFRWLVGTIFRPRYEPELDHRTPMTLMMEAADILGNVSHRHIGKSAVELNLGHRHRPLEEVSLQRRNARQSQQPALIGGFHPFSGRRDVEIVGERQCRRNDRRTICALCQVLGE